MLALLDADDRHHAVLRDVWEADPGAWVLPWAILPEVDYLVRTRLGPSTARLFAGDVAAGHFAIEFGQPADLIRAHELDEAYASLDLGLTDGVVAAVAERLGAAAIATLDVRDFAPLELDGRPKLFPRDL